MKKRVLAVTLLSSAMFSVTTLVSPFMSGRIVYAVNNTASTTEAAQTVSTDSTEKSTDSENAATDSQTYVTTEATEAIQQLTAEEQAAKEREEARLALQKDPNHIHNYKWVAKMNESESAEGTTNYMCVECGKIWYYRPIAPYNAFVGDVAHRIETAPEGKLVEVKTSLFFSFNEEVMEALAERPDVSLYVSFLDQQYKGNRLSFIIPAGEDTISLLDENGYAGFLFLGGKYGLTLEEAMIVPEVTESENTVTE